MLCGSLFYHPRTPQAKLRFRKPDVVGYVFDALTHSDFFKPQESTKFSLDVICDISFLISNLTIPQGINALVNVQFSNVAESNYFHPQITVQRNVGAWRMWNLVDFDGSILGNGVVSFFTIQRASRFIEPWLQVSNNDFNHLAIANDLRYAIGRHRRLVEIWRRLHVALDA